MRHTPRPPGTDTPELRDVLLVEPDPSILTEAVLVEFTHTARRYGPCSLERR